MIGQPLWKNLKTLVEIDNNIRKLKEKVKGEIQKVEINKNLIPKIQKNLHDLQLNCKEIKKKVDKEELIANDLKDKEEQKRKVLDKTKNEKEYRAIEKEIKRITLDRMELEDVLIQSWHKHDLAQKEIVKQEEQKNKEIDEIKAKTIELEIELKESQEKLEKALSDREISIKSIPTEWLHKYERMKENVPNPIVPVIKNSCSACYYNVIRQDLQRLKNHGMLLCRNCYRFLYYNKEEEKEETSNSY